MLIACGIALWFVVGLFIGRHIAVSCLNDGISRREALGTALVVATLWPLLLIGFLALLAYTWDLLFLQDWPRDREPSDVKTRS